MSQERCRLWRDLCKALIAVQIAFSTGSSVAQSPATQTIDIRNYGSTGDGKADDSAALKSAIQAMLARHTEGFAPCVHLSAGKYLLKSAMPLMTGPVCIMGDGSLHTILIMDPAYTGDLLAISDAWPGEAFPYAGNKPDWSKQRGGVILKGFSVSGDRSTENQQNAIVFYDRCMFVTVEDVEVRYVAGRALAFGLPKNEKQAFIQESRLSNIRLFNDGSPHSPVFEINAAGAPGTEGSGEIEASNIDIYAPYGPGLVIRNAGGSHLTEIYINRLRIEGLEYSERLKMPSADLLVIGDGTLKGAIDNITIRLAEILNPYGGHAAVRILASSPSSVPYAIDFEGTIGGGDPRGKGLVLDAGRSSRFVFRGLYSKDTELTVAAPPLIGPGLELGGPPGESRPWTSKVDRNSLRFISRIETLGKSSH